MKNKILLILLVVSTSVFAFQSKAKKLGFGNEFGLEIPVKVNVFPNPFAKTVNIDITLDKAVFTQTEIHVRNLIGKEMTEVIKSDNSTFNNGHFEVDLSDLPPGIYLLEINNNQAGSVSKVTRRITKL